MAAFNETLSKMNESNLKVMAFRAQMQTEEGRAEIQRKLAGMAQTSIFAGIRSKGILDPVVEQEMAEKALYGSVSSANTGELTKNVQQDLLNNLAKTGDPFLTTNKDGDTVSYNAWFARGRNLVDRFIKAQNKRDKGTKNSDGEQDATDVENVDAQEIAGALGAESEADPEKAFKREQFAKMKADAIRDTYDRAAQRLAKESGYGLADARLALLHLISKDAGVEIDPVPLGWKTEGDTSRVKQNLLKAIEPKFPQLFNALGADMKRSMASVLRAAEEQDLLSAPVIDPNNLTLESLIEASVYDEIVNGQSHKNAIAEAREKNSTSPLMPLLAKIDRSEVVAAVYSVLNNGKPFANSRDITALTQSDMQKALDSGLLPARIQETLQALVDLSGDGMAILQNSKNEGWRRWSELLGEQMGNRAPVQVVFNLALDPAVTGQGLWQEGTNTVHISPFLTREQGLMESTLLHEMMHPVWDWKVTAFQRGDLSQLNKKEVAALTELQDLLGLVKAEADKKLAGITGKAALEIAKRDLLGSTDLREFLNEAINHKPFQDFLAELKDPDAKAKGSLFRRIVNAILKLIRGGDVAEDSILQRSFELSLDLANYTDRELPIAERNKTQVEYFKKLEAQRGRKLTPEEAANAAADFAFKYPQPRIANTRAEASRLAPQVLTAPELDGFLASQAYEFVSPNDLEEALDLNGAIRELSSERQAQLRDFSNRVHEAFGMQGSTVTDAIGDWADGAEPTTVTEHNNPNLSYEEIKAMAALKGALRNQKAVIPFKVDGNGQQFLYDFFIPGQNIREARAIVAEAGIEFRTLIEQNGGTRVLVFDADGSVFDSFADLITKNKYEFQFNSGSGEFLGSWDSREEGKEVYTRTVEAEIARLGGQGRDLRPDSPEGVRIARLRNLAAEAGLTLGPVTEADIQQAPELAIVAALTGTAASQNEAAEILESAPNPTYYETLSNKGNDPITGSRTAIGRPANRRNRAGRNQPTDKERIPTRGADFPDEVRRGDRETHQRLERAGSGIYEALGGSASLQEQSVRLLDLLTGEVAAPEGSELAQTTEYLRSTIPVLPNSVLEGLKQRAEGMSSKVFVDTKNNSAYKLVSVSDKGSVGGSFPKDISIRAADDTVVITSEKGPSLLDILRAVAISNAQGNAVFTEIAGVTEGRDVILKQPYIKGLTPTDNFEDPEGLREALRDLGLSMLSDIGGISAVGKVGERYALFDDLHGENVMRDKNGRAQLVDALATRLLSNDEYTSVAPYLKDPEVLASSKVAENNLNEGMGPLSNKDTQNGDRIRTTLSSPSQGVGPESGSSQIQRQAVRPNAEPNPFVKEGIRGYNSDYGITPAIEGYYAPIDEPRAREIAAIYESLPVFDEGQETQEAYAKLAGEIQQQWDYAINKMGVTFEPWVSEGQPYANSREMVRDVRDNKHLWFFTGGELHPLLKEPDQNGLSINDKLRAIHDLFGHAAEDFQFGARGEENAWIKHSQMFSPVAQKALTTETRGQNSWVNFGPQNFNEDGSKKNIPAADRPFAQQKVALLPEQYMDWKGALGPEVLASVSVPFKGKDGAEGKFVSQVLDKAVAEPAQSAFLKPEEFAKAKDALLNFIQTPELSRAKSRGGRTVNLNSPDDSTARKLERATGQRWDGARQMLEARAIHALTEEDRTTPNADKIATAPMVPQTLQRADFIARRDFEGRPFLVFAKLYTDPDSPTGVRWHFVEAREDTGAFETQYSDTDPKRGRALAAKVIGVGDSTPKKKKALTGAGYAQGTAGESPSPLQGILPVPSDQGEVLDNTNVESVQNKILEEVDILTEKLNRLLANSDYTAAGKVQEQLNELTKQFDSLGVKQSAPVPFQGNVTPGFNSTVYTAADRRQTTAFTRVLNDPEYQGIRNALGGKQYISYTVDETLSKAEEFLNLPVHNGDLKTAFYAAGNATGITAEQVIMTKALAIQRAQKAANSARTSSGDMALSAATRNSMDTLARHYQDLADEFADDLMSQASLAGQELRAFRMLADSLSPYSWVRKYKQPIVHTQKLKMDDDPVFKEMLERIKAARRDAANSTTTRMQKALAIAAKRFVKDTSVEEIDAYEKFARLLASNLSVREEVMQAATEMAVVSGMEAVRKAVAPGDKADPAFLKQWEDKLRSIASEQLNGIIESRLQGGLVDAEASPELTEEQKMAAREQKIMDAWRDFSDFPLAEMVFNLARSTIIASDSPYSALVRKAQFDPAKIKRLQQAVKMSINTAEEIRKSVADRNMSVESLILRLQETNPSLSETEVGALAEAVRAVYDDEVQRASAAALQTIVNASKRDPRKLTDAATISRILPLVNMGAFKEEEVYNALADKFGLPTWTQENADKIEAMANQVQALPEGSIERGEKGQQMMLEILRANIKDSRGATRLQHMNQIASAVWTAGILSGPPTQIVNAAGTGLSVFLESFMDATGHFVEAKRRGVSTAQATEYYKDIARAWLFAFGKDANNTSLRAMNEVHTALTRGASKFKSEKQEDLSTLELFKFDPKVAIPGNAMMEAITTGEWKKALPQAGELGLGIVRTVSERVVNRDAKGALKDYLATLKMVGRGMLATDAMNSFAATAAKEMMIKRTLMQTEGLTDSEVNRQMKEIRKGGEESVVAAAKAQADQEAIEGSFGPAGTSEHNIGKARRVEQLIEQMTYGNSVMEQGRDFAANATFNSEAYGLIGATMMTVFGNVNRYAGVVAKPINPFPKTVSNLLNTSFNYTIYGYARAMGWNLGRLAIKEESKYFRAAPDRDSAEFYAAHAKATAGTLALGALAMMLAQALKDREEKKEPFFEVHGPGPKDPKLRAQWAQSGHKPFTVRIGGLELRYTDWPGINVPLGMLGTVYDNLTHTNKEADWVDQLFIGVASVLGTTLDRNMLGGATALFDLLSKNTYDGAKEAALGKLVSSYTGGFLKPSFVRYLETVATGGYQDARSMRGWFLSQIPVVGALANNPAINVLGEPIKVSAWDATAGRLVSQSDTHPILSPLTTADLVIPQPEAYKIYDSSKPTMVRPMSAQEEYEYAAAYGKIMKERLTPELVKSLTEQAKFAPQGAQDVLTSIATGVRNQAQGELAAKRQIQKGKELKGP